ncbi:MAG TPA: DUF6567 family protein [Rhodothermales bacterium]|nr:DUF6567 family protein [Rhodothermales bacterium]
MKGIAPLALVLALVPLTGCVTTGAFNSANLTNVELSQDNYRVVATNVSGEAEATYLLGLSAAMGMEMQTFALVRLSGNGMLYKAALDSLWRNFEARYGPVTDRALALVNVRYDSDALNVLGLFTRPRIGIRADVVEFNR